MSKLIVTSVSTYYSKRYAGTKYLQLIIIEQILSILHQHSQTETNN